MKALLVVLHSLVVGLATFLAVVKFQDGDAAAWLWVVVAVAHAVCAFIWTWLAVSEVSR